MFELFLSKTPNKEASPATARQARHTTEKYSLLFSFCARPISFSFNEKSIFLWCSAFQVFRQVAGLASIWFRKGKAEFPPTPPLRFSFSQTERERKQAGKNSFPPTPFLFALLLKKIFTLHYSVGIGARAFSKIRAGEAAGLENRAVGELTHQRIFASVKGC